ncbi:MAG: DivIVA domain-containing protein [Clostridia bacterium]|nr:DivIVA domain-containing protein [Clostridia bacterium]
MGEEKSFKKSAFGGFNRKDVIEYIEQLMAQLEAERAESRRKDERISDLERKLSKYEEACATSTFEITEDSADSEGVLAQIDAILLKYLGGEA